MSADNFTGQNISDTFRRLLQLSDNGSYITDGTGSIVNILPVTASYVLNGGGGTGTPGAPINSIQYNAGGGNFGGSSNLTYNGSNLNITGSILMSGSSTVTGVKSIDFDIIQDPTLVAQQEGRLFWNTSTKTLQLDLEQNFHTDLNQQLLVRVVNPYNFTLPVGTVVYITGSQGTRPTVATASWTGDQTSAATLGFTAKTINQNNNGYVITRGILDGVNTAGIPVGSQLYLSSSGQFTNQHIDAPLHEVRLGKVLVSDVNGSIYVDIMNGYELDELHDIKATNPDYGDLLMYSASLWTKSKQLSGSYGLTGSLDVSGSIYGSLIGTATWATSALTASTADNFTVRGNLIVSGTTTIGDATTDSITLNAVTMSLGSGTGILNIDSNTFVVDGANNRVGILKNNPSTALDISGSVLITGSLNITGSITTAGTISVGTTTTTDIIAGTDWLKVVAGATTFGLSTGNSGQGFISVTNGTVTGFGGHTNNTDGMVFGSFSNHGLALRTNNANRLTINNTGTVTINGPFNATGGITGSLLGTATNSLITASISSNILTFTKGDNTTFNLTVPTGSGGGGGTPGSPGTSIQYNNSGVFGGISFFNYNNSLSKLTFNPTVDIVSTPFAWDGTGSIFLQNDPQNTQKNTQLVSHIVPIGANSAANVIKFTAIDSGILKIKGFKCDYCIDTDNGMGTYESRIGTLLCSFNRDTGVTPIIVDSYTITPNGTDLNLNLANFRAGWIGSTEIGIELQCSSINYTSTFNGVFTVFASRF